jgi:3-deoxy-D-manno-octulosonic-acid transferase
MEPASQGVPMIMGRYRRNIDDIADQFIQAGAMEVVSDQKELLAVWQGMLVDKPKLTHMADAALVVMNANRGALDRVEKVILAIIDG